MLESPILLLKVDELMYMESVCVFVMAEPLFAMFSWKVQLFNEILHGFPTYILL